MNQKIFYINDVEKAVLAGQQQHLKAPHLLKEFAKSYQEERERLASEKRRVRGKLETQWGQIKRGIDRILADYEAERVSMGGLMGGAIPPFPTTPERPLLSSILRMRRSV